MGRRRSHQAGMSLFTSVGDRKYLSTQERARFLDAAAAQPAPTHRTFCAMLHWTGCRPSEARALTIAQVDLESCAIVIRSLKKRGPNKESCFRIVPVPQHFIDVLEEVHGVKAAQTIGGFASRKRLWGFSRTTGWRIVRAAMCAAGLNGAKASAKGLRHAFGVHAALRHVPITRIKVWLGHSKLETTEIYLDVAAPEDRALAERMW